MRLEFTKQMKLIEVEETKNKNPKYQFYVLYDKATKESITVLGEKKPVQENQMCEVSFTLRMDKKTVVEQGKKVQYDIGSLFLNSIKSL